MTTRVTLTPRDEEILLALALKVRLFSQRQIADHWREGELANTRRRMKVLAAAGFVQRLTVLIRSMPAIESPVATWQPQDSPPDFGQVAYRLRHRWHRRAVRETTAYIATARTAQLYGARARGELKQPTQATHDIGVAAIWLRLHSSAPAWADAWQSEDQLAHTRRGQKLPDAFIVDREGVTAWVIEFGGSYDTARVQAFHEDCAGRDLPYQIW